MDNKLKIPCLIVLGGYIFSVGFYFIWYWATGYDLINPMRYISIYVLDIAVGIFVITLIYFFTLLLIWHTVPLQNLESSFFVVSIITILTFFLIPSGYYANYQIEKAITKAQTQKIETNAQAEQKHMKDLEAKLNEAIKKNNTSENFIAGLKATLNSVRKENINLNAQLNEKIGKIQHLEAEQKTREKVVVQATSNKNISNTKINPKTAGTESHTTPQEIIFRVQIISSSTRLAKNSSKFKSLKSVWEYKDNGLYKYTVGSQKDIKSAYALQLELRKNGFSEAFVVAFKNGKRIPVREAEKLLTADERRVKKEIRN
jgi:hypothetical protein